jgi:hypothetical protein
MSFKFGGVDKHTVCLFVYFICLFCLFLSVYIYFYAILLFRHNLRHNCKLHVNGVFNLFEETAYH